MIWKREYELGVPEIDNQHKTLVEFINNFKNSIPDSTTDTRTEMGKVLIYLINYTCFHFEAEEQLMSQINYPNLEQHKIIHQNLISKTKAILIKMKQKESYTPIEFYYFLMSWLNEHILHEDLQIKKYYKNNKLEQTLEKQILQIPESIVISIKANLEIISMNIKKNNMTIEDQKIQRSIYLNNFFSKFSFEEETSLSNIFKSIDILETKKVISSQEKSSLLEELNKI